MPFAAPGHYSGVGANSLVPFGYSHSMTNKASGSNTHGAQVNSTLQALDAWASSLRNINY
jgi:hypothetical protein